MKIYLVGGAVRNKLLGIPIHDRDWVVVGATSKDLIKLGFRQVGKGFPVFLHPKTNEEYALARTEKKIASGYLGFSCHVSPLITIEDDLFRRDLTINAIAQDKTGKFIDPYYGIKDIKKRLLRHISPSFIEDPLRVLRVARFSSQLFEKKFSIAEETKLLMNKMVKNNELNTLNPERLWSETKKALLTMSPDIYFQVLHDCGALRVIFPEIDKLFSLEISCFNSENLNSNYLNNLGKYMLLSLRKVSFLTKDIETRFSIISYYLYRSVSNFNLNQNFYKNSHVDFVKEGIFLIESMCKRIHIPKKIREFSKLCVNFYHYICKINRLSSESVINLFNRLDSWRNPNRIKQIAIFYESSIVINNKLERRDFYYSEQSKFLVKSFHIVQHISKKEIIENNVKGYKFNQRLTELRVQELNKWRKYFL